MSSRHRSRSEQQFKVERIKSLIRSDPQLTVSVLMERFPMDTKLISKARRELKEEKEVVR